MKSGRPQGTRPAMARYFSIPLLLMALLMISTVIPSVSSKETSLDKKKPSFTKIKLLRGGRRRLKLPKKPK
ncbi:unnamed protein product [Haemonchus placei]|uniref:Uncharacterized protein n=1 Tax=Haemonchus placei TaxID=6290 RepID=A0A0N4X5U2_HAEPC|nr:unnamed protein product [Haemonchus placei]